MYSNLNHSPLVTEGQAKIPKYLVCVGIKSQQHQGQILFFLENMQHAKPSEISMIPMSFTNNKQQETTHYGLNFLVIEAISQTH